MFDEARRNGAELPVTALVDQFYAEVQAMGGSRWDTSSLIALLERKIELPCSAAYSSGSAVVYLICSMAKAELTSDSSILAISFL